MTKLASALESGLAGASTISLLTNTLRKPNNNGSHTGLFGGKDLRKRFKKAGAKKPLKATGDYIQMAGDLLGNSALLGLSGLQKKEEHNVAWRVAWNGRRFRRCAASRPR